MHQAWFGVLLLAEEGLLTAGTGAGLAVQGSGLACQTLIEHFLSKELADVQQEGFDLSQLGPPSRALLAVELLHQVFGDSLDITTHFFYLCRPLLLPYHPEFLPGVASKLCSRCLKAL